ncbi:mitochondrial 54S ribosomal protein rml2 [Spiromyces aspiralis]|uniref:Mitochondrial 54S ribosomal protein rml2 n=1 Tax=Spiromyces aspiralis TaxID=68401 RepID=A0ACC1HGQ6_9FUNG|nr:mitochondrial 54S ribosomal protein rml2 [Spiromyces aspiralis]
MLWVQRFKTAQQNVLNRIVSPCNAASPGQCHIAHRALLGAAKRSGALRFNSTAAESSTAKVTGVTRDDGVFKTWKPITPGVRHKRMASRQHLHKGKPVRALTVAKRRTGGRNHHGRITCRHRGGGAKRRIRLVDFKRRDGGPQEVVRLEYDPGRTAHIALIRHLETGKLSYILAPAQLKPGMIVQSFIQQSEQIDREARLKQQQQEQHAEEEEIVGESVSQPLTEGVEEEEPNAQASGDGKKLWQPSNMNRSVTIAPGNCLPLKMIPAGTLIHNIGLHKGEKGRLARAAGTYAQLLYTSNKGCAQIKLMSGEVRRVPVDVCATIGTVSNPNHKHESLGKAGARRLRGWRPSVRGVAMNKKDHPHGGGRGKSKSKHHPVSPWGKPAKGGKTRLKPNPMVIRPRSRS